MWIPGGAELALNEPALTNGYAPFGGTQQGTDGEKQRRSQVKILRRSYDVPAAAGLGSG